MKYHTKKTLFKALYISCIFINFITAQNPDNYTITPLCNLNLNRTATTLNPTLLATVSPAEKGFIWNTSDNSTLKYRPQGITGIDLDCKKYIAVSWYGRSSESYANRGVRISFVDVSDMNSIHYRHVLLVDENYNTFNDMHGGGIQCINNTLYVPDTRSGSNKRIYAFNLNDIKRVPDSDLGNFHNYRYIIKKTATYLLPIQPSCLSYDWDTNDFLIGSFKLSSTPYSTFNTNSTFAWFQTNTVNTNSPFHINFFDRIQGVASINDFTDSTKKMIWTSQSYGRSNTSKLYATTYNRNPNTSQNQNVNTTQLDYLTYTLPPGLEDLHFEQNKDTLWSLTEFGPNENGTSSDGSTINNNRLVFAFSKLNILAPNIDTSLYINSNENTPSKIQVYPNPNSGKFYIETIDTLNTELLIIDNVGRIVFKSILNKNKIEVNLNTGIYVLKILSNKKNISKKIIIQ